MMLALCLTTAVFAQSPCDPPTNVTVVPGTTSATVSWTGNSELYNVQYLHPTFYFGADDDEGFEGWLSHDADSDGYGWEISSGEGRNGSDAFVSFSYFYDYGGALDPDNWLITPVIDLGGTMSVWLKSYFYSYPDNFAIYIITDPDWMDNVDLNNLEDEFTLLIGETTAPAEYTEYTADLSEYAGMQGRIAIRHFNSYDQYRLYMDDFSVNGQTLLSNVSSPVELPGLIPEAQNQVQVQAICTSGVSEWSDPVEFTTHGLCDVPSSLSVTPSATTASLEWTGYQDQYTVRYQTLESYNSYLASGMATVTLTIGDVWGDGSGYQMLLDANATAYGTIIPESGGLTTGGDASEEVYSEFEYKIPENADGALNTSNIVFDNSVSITIPAGIYDWCITNPTPGDRMWIASSNGTVNGREDDYVFEAGKNYEFVVTLGYDGRDRVDLTITDAVPESNWTTVTNASNPVVLTGLTPNTTYVMQVQGVCEDGVTAWTELVEFTTTDETEPCEISVINIEGFTVPEWGANPDLDVYVEDTRCTLTDWYWKENNASILSETDIFNHENATYYMRFIVSPNEGCTFADDVTITINGDESMVDDYYTSLSSDHCDFYSIDFNVTKPATEPCAVPTGLEVLDITGNSATVNWDPSDAENYDLRYYVALDELENESWQYYDDGTNNDAIGGVGTFWWGVMFPGGNYSSSTTAAVLHVKAFDYEATTGTVTLYNDGDNAPANPVGSTNFTFTGSNQFVEFTFDEPVAIDPSKNLWVVFNNESGAHYPAAACANTGDPNGRWVSLDGSTWEDLSNYSLDNTFMIRAGIFDVDVNELSWTEIHGLSDNTASLTGLAANTDYKVQVRANCEYSESAWSDPVEFTTLEETEPVEPSECGLAEDCEGTSYPTVKIGDLCWMQKNLAAVSCVTSGNVYAYVNDQFPDEDANVAAYGLLYDEEAVMQGIGTGAKAEAANTGICPEGWRLPTVAEIEALGAAYTADELKSTNYWIPGGGGTDAAGLGWLPGGCYNDNAGRYESMLLEGYLWATEEVNGETQPAMYKITYYCSTILMRVEDFEGLSASVRCVKEAGEEPEFTCGDNLIIGENSYPTVQIGTQCWTKTNLREAAGTNGTDLTSDNYSYTEPFYYVNPNVDAAVYGYYYNWPAANQVCPKGWHLPSDEEWHTMMEYVGAAKDAEGNYKYRCNQTYLAQSLATNEDYWYRGDIDDDRPCEPEYDLTQNNKTGFSAVPAGYWKVENNGFNKVGLRASFWSSTDLDNENHPDHARAYGIFYNSQATELISMTYRFGISVRCVRNE